MSQPSSIDTPENWSNASAGYAEYVAPRLMAPFMDEFADDLDISPEHSVLEIACGSGAFTSALATRAKDVLATDFSPAMLDEAKSKIKRLGHTNVSFALQDGQALTLDAGSFDRVASSFGVMLFPERHKGFAEMYRILKPGGRVVVTAWADPDRFEAFRIFISAMRQAFPEMPQPDSPPPVFSLSNLVSFKEQMETAGFVNVETRYVTRTMTVEGFDMIWAMMTAGAPPVKMLFDQVGEWGISKVKEALREIIASQFGDGPISLKNAATLGSGTKG